MSKPDKSFAEALHEAHTDLLRDLQDVERVVSAGSQEAPQKLSVRLGQLRTHLADHFRFEEEGGYMAPVLKQEPRLAPAIQELLAEHGQMAQTLSALIQEVDTTPSLPETLREKVRAWVGRVRHHETRENNLVQEAYYSEGATGD
jgi:iron-sulfur cluster repair protein YtfE (RIC family)